MPGPVQTVEVVIPAGGLRLGGSLSLPVDPLGVVAFAHGSGSSRHSPRNRAVAEHLNGGRLGTLLFDLLLESEAADRGNVFNIRLLADRLAAAPAFLRGSRGTAGLPVAYFGASTGAAAALIAAADDRAIGAVVSRGGRPDLAGDRLPEVTAPTLLIVGGADHGVIELNRDAYEQMRCEKRLEIVPGATHLFEESGAMERVADLARRWLANHLSDAAEAGRTRAGTEHLFHDRTDAGRQLARALEEFRGEAVVVVGLPRGGVVVAAEVAAALDAPLDILVVRKIGAPEQQELGIGAVVDGTPVLDHDLVRRLAVTEAYLREETARQIAEIRRREAAYRRGRPAMSLSGRTVIVVDDGVATGASTRAALRAVRRRGPARLVLAVPVGSPETLRGLASEADDLVCLETPEEFRAVGQFYEDFEQTEDDQVIALLDRARGREEGRATA